MELLCKIGVRVVFIFLLVRCYPESSSPVAIKPSQELTPLDVVTSQLKAFQNNDSPYPNAGIETAYNFASPYQKAENGPYRRYENMYNSRRFNTLIHCSEFFIEKHFANDKKAEYFVFVTDKNGNEWIFLFRLSRQTEIPYSGCWMTDSILAYADARSLTGNYYLS